MTFNIGDKAEVTQKIRRVDGKAEVQPGQIVTIIGATNTSSGNQIVDIQPPGDSYKLVDIVIFSDDGNKPLKKITRIVSEPNWMNDAAGRIFTYAIEWNGGRKVWRDDDIVNIIKHASTPEVITGGCICGHGFNDHEHPARPWMPLTPK